MTSTARTIARRLRRRIRPLLRASPALWDEFRRTRRAHRPTLAHVVFVAFTIIPGFPIFLIGSPFFLASRYWNIGGIDFLGGASGALSLCITLVFAWGGFLQLRIAPMSRLLRFLPVPDEQIARRALRHASVGPLLFIVWGIAPYLVAAWHGNLPLAAWAIALGFGLLQWLVAMAVGISLGCLIPQASYQQALGYSLFFSILLMLVQPAQAPLIANLLYTLTPGGWVAAAYSRGWLGGNPLGWIGLLPASVVLVVSWRVWRTWPRTYVAIEPPMAPAHLVPATEPPRLTLHRWLAWVRGAMGHDDDALDADASRRQIASREFLRPSDYNDDTWAARLERRWLSPQERAVAEWSSYDSLQLGTDARGLFAVVVATALINLTGWARSSSLGWLVLMMLLVSQLDWLFARLMHPMKGCWLDYCLLPISYRHSVVPSSALRFDGDVRY